MGGPFGPLLEPILSDDHGRIVQEKGVNRNKRQLNYFPSKLLFSVAVLMVEPSVSSQGRAERDAAIQG
jgi:hypothetical protein